VSPHHFTERLNEVVRGSVDIARSFGQDYVTPEHLLLSLVGEGDGAAAAVLSGMDVDRDALGRRLEEFSRQRGQAAAPAARASEGGAVSRADYTTRARRVLSLASQEGDRLGHAFVGTELLLLGILLELGYAADAISAMGGTLSRAREHAERLAGVGGASAAQRGATAPPPPLFDDVLPSGADEAEHGGVGAAGASPLARYCRDLTAQARLGRLDPVIGRDAEIARAVEILCRRKKNNLVLVGEAGVGKTAIAEGLARRIASGEIARPLRGRRVLALDLPALIGGTQLRGQFEDRLRALIQEVRAVRDVILFIDEIHTLIGAGGGDGAMDAVNILKPALARGELQCIGATTTDEYRLHIEKDAALERRFQPVEVRPPSPSDAERILYGVRTQYESYHGVRVPEEVLAYAVRMAERYVHDRQLPDKAIDLLDEACSRVVIRASEAEEEGGVVGSDTPIVTDADVAGVVATWTGIPVERLSQEEARRLLALEAELSRRVRGQEDAVVSVSQAIRRSRANLRDPNRPIGSFLLAGPTGVGKTEIARSLADLLFDDKDALIRIDMSEHMEKHTVSRLIGAPPGYVGYEEGGTLTEAVRRRPYAVVLLDEIEKAHPDIFNILLQVLDDGHLTDSHGRRVSFKDVLVVMTTNLGAAQMAERPRGIGFGAASSASAALAASRERVVGAIEETLAPEFVNRIDEIVVFDPLSAETVAEIARILMKKLEARLAESGKTLEVTERAMALLVEKGYDARYGARPLRRAIQRYVENPLADRILRGDFREGSHIVADLGPDGRLQFTGGRGGALQGGIDCEVEPWAQPALATSAVRRGA
jgi:ATP-dependent Clp protease ATP-binding subunit ClpC